ncbi:hypothetical protein [Streptomyces sp. NPDC059916]|uniref:hypothetical protein n=1 Tax=Streptomyces sp. NPDC059916 TaxID=3347001 RepID=UPI003696ECD9
MTSFSDDFNRADSTALGANWVEVTGDWSISSNRLSPGAAGGTIILRAAAPMASSDHYAQATIAATAAASHGIWCRGNTTLTSGYLWRNDGSNWTLFAVIGGSFVSIGSYAAAAAAGDVAKVQAVGTTIKGYVNGTQRVSVTDTGVTTGTSVGVRSESVAALRFDDFSAADVTTGTTLTLSPAGSLETAQPFTATKTGPLATAGKTSSARTLTGIKTAALAAAGEQGTVLAFTGLKTGTLGATDTLETGQPLTGYKTAVLQPAIEEDTALTFAGTKTSMLTTAASLTTALPLGPATWLPTAHMTEEAQPITAIKTAALPTAIEVYAARPLARQVTAAPSPQRTIHIPSEQRRLVVPAEDRTLKVR